MLACGEILEGRYRILSQIGEGGMSRVFLARDERIDKVWAVKQAKTPADPDDRRLVSSCFFAEAELMRTLDHISFPRIVDVICRSDGSCVVMDYIEGQTLDEVLRAQGAQPQDRVISWGRQLGSALCYLHARTPPVIYRDLKPGNVMLQDSGRVRLIDFGAVARHEVCVADGQASLGTPGYAAPEQLDCGVADVRTDVFGLGMTLRVLATGRPPDSHSARQSPGPSGEPCLSEGLWRVIDIATRPDPAERYQSCAELVCALESCHLFDRDYRAGLRRRLARFLVSCMLAGLMLVAGLALLVCAGVRVDRSYDALVAQARQATDDDQRASCYRAAIEEVPTRMEAYRGLVALFGEDEAFTLDEERLWQEIAVPTLACVQGDEGYAELCFEVGRLYWFSYDFGSGSLARWRAALPWFEQAACDERFERHETARTYANAARAGQSLVDHVGQGEETSEDYRAYFEEVCALVELCAQEQSAYERLAGLQIAMRMLFDEHAGIAGAGVGPEEMERLVDDVYSRARATDASSVRAHRTCEQLLAGEDALRAALASDRAERQRLSLLQEASSRSPVPSTPVAKDVS